MIEFRHAPPVRRVGLLHHSRGAQQVERLAHQSEARQVGQQGAQHRLGNANLQDLPRVATLGQTKTITRIPVGNRSRNEGNAARAASGSPWKRADSRRRASASHAGVSSFAMTEASSTPTRSLKRADGQRHIEASGDGGVEQLFLEDAAAVVLDKRIVVAGRFRQRLGVNRIEQRQHLPAFFAGPCAAIREAANPLLPSPSETARPLATGEPASSGSAAVRPTVRPRVPGRTRPSVRRRRKPRPRRRRCCPGRSFRHKPPRKGRLRPLLPPRRRRRPGRALPSILPHSLPSNRRT